MSLVISGAKALIKIGGDVFAFASGVSVTHENRLEEIPQLDNLDIAEFAENGHRCSISINSIKLTSNASIAGNPISNDANDFFLDDPLELKKILLQPEYIIEIVESVPSRDSSGNITSYTEVPIYIAFGSKFEGGTGQLDARGVWQGTWNFRARRGTGI